MSTFEKQWQEYHDYIKASAENHFMRTNSMAKAHALAMKDAKAVFADHRPGFWRRLRFLFWPNSEERWE